MNLKHFFILTSGLLFFNSFISCHSSKNQVVVSEKDSTGLDSFITQVSAQNSSSIARDACRIEALIKKKEKTSDKNFIQFEVQKIRGYGPAFSGQRPQIGAQWSALYSFTQDIEEGQIVIMDIIMPIEQRSGGSVVSIVKILEP